ncbi:hypothetical protein SASPL_152542 [Salvia splendens]|uniref:Retrotransposon gag domain-containing protein n=1 Tax=Salvia splendens TaxID=180675 RepID=A0A8X8W3I1_SALSN|nr:hypothetical protein SASPL_152542 [Salvia splendens]
MDVGSSSRVNRIRREDQRHHRRVGRKEQPSEVESTDSERSHRSNWSRATSKSKRLQHSTSDSSDNPEESIDKSASRRRNIRMQANRRPHGDITHNHETGTGRKGASEFRLKIDIPSFDGTLNIEDFLDWVTDVDRFFEHVEVPSEKRAATVACRLKSGAAAWWDKQLRDRELQGKARVCTWRKMRGIIIDEYLPDYDQISEKKGVVEGFKNTPAQQQQGGHPNTNPYSRPFMGKCYRCGGPGKIFTILIDGGSMENIIGGKVARTLELQMEPHPNPYTLGWIAATSGGILVAQRCKVPFSIGNGSPLWNFGEQAQHCISYKARIKEWKIYKREERGVVWPSNNQQQ